MVQKLTQLRILTFGLKQRSVCIGTSIRHTSTNFCRLSQGTSSSVSLTKVQMLQPESQDFVLDIMGRENLKHFEVNKKSYCLTKFFDNYIKWF